MFADRDWPVNAARGLSASDKFIVSHSVTYCQRLCILGHNGAIEICLLLLLLLLLMWPASVSLCGLTVLAPDVH